MTLSVIIPIYNGEKFLAQAISSVLSQPCRDLELVLVNDGSTDGTHEICQSFAKEDSRVTYIAKENEGVSEARNTGINTATGTYIAFLDADDWWIENTYTEDLCEHINESNADMFVFGMAWTDREHNICSTYVPEISKIYTGLSTGKFAWLSFGCFFYRKQMLLDEGIFFLKDFFFHEDAIFCRQSLCCAKQLETFQRPLYVYRDNAMSVVHTTKELVAFRQRFLALQQIIKFFHKKAKIDPLHPDTFSTETARFYLSTLEKTCCILNYREWKHTFVDSPHTANILVAMENGLFQYGKVLYSVKKTPWLYYWKTRIKKRSYIFIRSFFSQFKQNNKK